ncbi:MAG TPA: hypothetical protein PK467_06470 [Candidatus Wallbacteria bacterium]|nr:hypothetical protein [Candidatus Wallbacteria bacterium]
MLKRIIIATVLVLVLSSGALAETFTLKPGFNFISFTSAVTLTPSGFKALNASIEDMYLYSAAAGSFLSLSEGTLTTLAAGKGYIVKNMASSNISVTVSGSSPGTIGNISLKSGFNLVGFSKLPSANTFTQLMNAYSFIQGLYKWNAAAGSFIQVVRESGVPVKIDGTDPSINAGESYFFNLTQDVQINYDGTSILMGANIVPPVVDPVENPFAGTYNGTFNGTFGAPQGTFVITVTTQGALAANGTNNSNVPPTMISGSGTVTNAGAADFSIKLNNFHKFSGTFTSSGASGSFYETDGLTVKGSWQVTKVGGSN